jgi:hypothetical protein
MVSAIAAAAQSGFVRTTILDQARVALRQAERDRRAAFAARLEEARTYAQVLRLSVEADADAFLDQSTRDEIDRKKQRFLGSHRNGQTVQCVVCENDYPKQTQQQQGTPPTGITCTGSDQSLQRVQQDSDQSPQRVQQLGAVDSMGGLAERLAGLDRRLAAIKAERAGEQKHFVCTECICNFVTTECRRGKDGAVEMNIVPSQAQVEASPPGVVPCPEFIYEIAPTPNAPMSEWRRRCTCSSLGDATALSAVLAADPAALEAWTACRQRVADAKSEADAQAAAAADAAAAEAELARTLSKEQREARAAEAKEKAERIARTKAAGKAVDKKAAEAARQRQAEAEERQRQESIRRKRERRERQAQSLQRVRQLGAVDSMGGLADRLAGLDRSLAAIKAERGLDPTSTQAERRDEQRRALTAGGGGGGGSGGGSGRRRWGDGSDDDELTVDAVRKARAAAKAADFSAQVWDNDDEEFDLFGNRVEVVRTPAPAPAAGGTSGRAALLAGANDKGGGGANGKGGGPKIAAVLGGAKKSLAENIAKLGDMADTTQEMEENASSFADMARQLREKEEKKSSRFGL